MWVVLFNLYTRLDRILNLQYFNEGNRLINQSMKTFGINKFKLDYLHNRHHRNGILTN